MDKQEERKQFTWDDEIRLAQMPMARALKMLKEEYGSISYTQVLQMIDRLEHYSKGQMPLEYEQRIIDAVVTGEVVASVMEVLTGTSLEDMCRRHQEMRYPMDRIVGMAESIMIKSVGQTARMVAATPTESHKAILDDEVSRQIRGMLVEVLGPTLPIKVLIGGSLSGKKIIIRAPHDSDAAVHYFIHPSLEDQDVQKWATSPDNSVVMSKEQADKFLEIFRDLTPLMEK